ncbi:MAG TPA: efflux RND transporter periplasmic adaptor subunit [Vicinamibacteria bacterium]|nr:efflux RND transporter periplasmic adaptor subunit [Vicinamibacteria bacterium]
MTWKWSWMAVVVMMTLAACAAEQTAEVKELVRPVKTLVVGGAGARPASYPGRVEAASQVNLSFRVGGPLLELPVLEGQVVRNGELLARIDPRDFQIRLDAAKADFERADADLRRFSALYEKEAVSQAQLDQARATRNVAQAQVEDAEASLRDTYLRAPYRGQVAETFVENFEEVRAGQPILSLIDVNEVKVVVDAPEGVLAQVSRPQLGRITARYDSAPEREFDLTLREVATQADPRTQTYRVTFQMPQPGGLNVLPGMTATVTRYPSEGASGAMVVPAVAVFADASGAPHVWVVDSQAMTVASRAVTTGELTGSDSIVIASGLQPGERIATTGVAQLSEGMKIRELSELEGYQR